MTGRIFINYRRGDEPGSTGRLFDRLEQAFTSDRLFMDVDHIGPGQDFVRVLEEEVGKCEILLAVIGKGWIDARDENGQRRLENPNDFVRIEIESALKQGKHLIPVLINDAQMPRGDDLPESMKDLSRRNAVRIVHERFKSDAQGLVKILEASLAKIEAARALKTEEERRAAEEALRRKQEDEAARAAEGERQAQQRAREQAAAGLSSEEIRKAEELANWDFIKAASDATELRNHLARFPGGVTERYARAALEDIVWKEASQSPNLDALEAFLAEFPTGKHYEEAASRRADLSKAADAARQIEARKRKETDDWAKASSEDTNDAYEAFLAEWPKSVHASAARSHIRKLKMGSAPDGPWLAIAAALCALTPLGMILGLAFGQAPIVATLILMSALGISIGVRGRQLTGEEIALYWATASVALTYGLAELAMTFEWRPLGEMPASMGLVAGALATLATGVTLVFLRRGRLGGAELSLYWLGAAHAMTLLLVVLFDWNDWNWAGEYTKHPLGLVAAVLLSFILLALLLRRRWHVVEPVEIAIYSLGTSMAALAGLICLIEISKANTLEGICRGFFAGSVLIALGTALLMWRRRAKIEAAELRIYFLQLALAAAIALAALDVLAGWNLLGDEGNIVLTFVIFSFPLLVLTGLAALYFISEEEPRLLRKSALLLKLVVALVAVLAAFTTLRFGWYWYGETTQKSACAKHEFAGPCEVQEGCRWENDRCVPGQSQ